LGATAAIVALVFHEVRRSSPVALVAGVVAGFFGVLLLLSRLNGRRWLRRRR